MLWLVDHPAVFFVATFSLLVVSARIGVLASTRGHRLASADRAEFDLVRNAMFTLLGLMVGFAISMAVSRYDLRKSYEEAEANAIGTEYLRLDLLSPETTAAARALLRSYVDERIAFYRDRDPNRLEKTDAATMETMNALWAAIMPEAKTRQTPTDALVASGMTDVLNSQGYTLAAWRNRLPVSVDAVACDRGGLQFPHRFRCRTAIACHARHLAGHGRSGVSPNRRRRRPAQWLCLGGPVNLENIAAAMREK